MPSDAYNAINGLQTLVNEPFYNSVRDRNKRLGLHADVPEFRFGPMAKAHTGVLLVDEIGELKHANQTALLTALEDGIERVPARVSFGAWATDPKTPKWMAHFVCFGIPASFILIGATTREPHELDAALRSRCEVVKFRELNFADRREIAKRIAAKQRVRFTDDVLDRIAATTSSGRDASRRVLLAAAAARRRKSDVVEEADAAIEAATQRAGFRK